MLTGTSVTSKGPLFGVADFLESSCFSQVTLSPTSQVWSIFGNFNSIIMFSCWLSSCLHGIPISSHGDGKNSSLPKTNWPGVACNVVWWEHLVAWAAALVTSSKGLEGWTSFSSISCVLNMSFETWWIFLTIEFAWGLCVVFGLMNSSWNLSSAIECNPVGCSAFLFLKSVPDLFAFFMVKSKLVANPSTFSCITQHFLGVPLLNASTKNIRRSSNWCQNDSMKWDLKLMCWFWLTTLTPHHPCPFAHSLTLCELNGREQVLLTVPCC